MPKSNSVYTKDKQGRTVIRPGKVVSIGKCRVDVLRRLYDAEQTDYYTDPIQMIRRYLRSKGDTHVEGTKNGVGKLCVSA